MDGSVHIRTDFRHTGVPMRRREDAPLLRGEGRFVADLRPPNCLAVTFVRSTMANACIAAIDTREAARAPGVYGVYTATDLNLFDGGGAVNALIPDLRPRSFEVLARDRTDAVGQPVAAVVAETQNLADDAAEQVVTTLQPAAPRDLAGYDHIWRSDRHVDAVLSVGVSVRHARLAAMPMEPRGTLAAWQDGRLVVYVPTQSPQRARADLARLLGLDPAILRVIAPDVGGSFGAKASIYPEDVFTAWAALRLRSAVAWAGSRAEDLLAGTHGRGIATDATLSVDEGGRMLGLRARIAAPMGHWMPFSAVVPGRNAGRILPGPYRILALDTAVRGRTDATAPMGIYRGAGRPEAAMLVERLVDRAARARGEDPVAFRRRNLIPSHVLPCRTLTGATLDGGDYPALLEHAVALANYDAARDQQSTRRAAGELVGLGIGMYLGAVRGGLGISHPDPAAQRPFRGRHRLVGAGAGA